MKLLWNALSFLAITNLLAIVLFAGWLWQSGRLDSERLEKLRDLLGPTIAEAQQLAAEAAAADALQDAVALESERQSGAIPLRSEQRIALRQTFDRAEQQQQQRLRDQQRELLNELAVREAALKSDVEAFEQMRQQWLAGAGGERQRAIDSQFAQAVAQFSALPPKQGKQIISRLVERGEIEQAVAYLDAMDERAAGKVLKEFKSESEIELATILLERLRTFTEEVNLARNASDEHQPVVNQ